MNYEYKRTVGIPPNLVCAQYSMGIGGMVLRTMILSQLNYPGNYEKGFHSSITLTEEDWSSVMGSKTSLKIALNQILACEIRFTNNCQGYSMLSDGRYITNENKIVIQLNNKFLARCYSGMHPSLLSDI